MINRCCSSRFPYSILNLISWPWVHPSFLHSLYTLSTYYTDAPACNSFFVDKISFLTYFVFFHVLVYLSCRLVCQLFRNQNVTFEALPPSGGSPMFLSMKIINVLLSAQSLTFDLHAYSHLLIFVVLSHLATEFVLIGSFQEIDLIARISSVIISVLFCRYIYSPILW